MLFRSPSPINPKRKWQTTLVAAPFARLPQSGGSTRPTVVSLTIQQVFHPHYVADFPPD